MRLRHTLLALGLLLITVSCGGPSEPLIGALIPETGDAAGYGSEIRAGMEVATEEINAAGGVGGQPLRILYADTGTDPEKGVAAARKLIEQDGVPALIGAVSSTVTMDILQQVAEPAGVPLLSPAASSPNLTDLSPFFFRVYPSDSLEGGRMAELVGKELRRRRLVVFSVADEYGSGYKKSFVERYRRQKNREVLKVFNFMAGDTDFAAQLAETQKLDPDGIFVIGYERIVAHLARQIRQAGITVPILSSGSIRNEFISLAGEAGEGLMFSRPSFRIVGNPDEASRFIQAFQAKHGREPGDHAAYGYDAVKIMAQIMSLGNLAPRDIHLGLKSPASQYKGVTGDIVFGNVGDVVALPTTFIVANGEIVPFKEYLEQGGVAPGTTPEE